jgi:hypothetical protein
MKRARESWTSGFDIVIWKVVVYCVGRGGSAPFLPQNK